jgi:hypothetical protein
MVLVEEQEILVIQQFLERLDKEPLVEPLYHLTFCVVVEVVQEQQEHQEMVETDCLH